MLELKEVPNTIYKEDLNFTTTIDYWKVIFEEKKSLPRLIIICDEMPNIHCSEYFLRLKFNTENYDEQLEKLEQEKIDALSWSLIPDEVREEFDIKIADLKKEREDAILSNPDMQFFIKIEKWEKKWRDSKACYELRLVIDVQIAMLILSTKNEFVKYDWNFNVFEEWQVPTSIDLLVW